MKKIIKLIGAFLCFVPFVVNAKYYYNYNDAVVKVNDYINTFANNDKYIYFPRNISRNDYYIGGVGSDNFTAGGLVNAEEFDITNVNGTSYLSSTSKYWTLSVPELQNNNRYVIDFEKDILSTSETSGIKVTQFIKDDAKVTGIGTRSNPFMFVNSSKVIIKTSDINKGGFSNNNTNCNNIADTIIANVSTFREIHELCPAVGYTYDTDNCGDSVSIVNNSGKTKIYIENKGYDAACNIEFAPITYYVKYNANDGSGSMPNSIHTYGTAKALTTNAFTRSGYKFTGWNTKEDGSGTSYANGATVNNLISTNGGIYNLYAKWEKNVIYCDALNQTIKCSNKNVTNPTIVYTGECNIICEGNNWKVKLTSSGKLTVSSTLNVDLFIVGGGGGGSGAPGAKGFNYSGSDGGGAGGNTIIKNNVSLNGEYQVVIGAGGNAGDHNNGSAGGTTYFDQNGLNYSAAGGQGGIHNNNYDLQNRLGGGGAGGSGTTSSVGGNGRYGNDNGYDGGPGVYAFDETSGDKYACGGKSGTKTAGAANTGNGGGGGSGYLGWYSPTGCAEGGTYCDAYRRNGGAGGSGVVIIRNKRN